MTSSSCAGEQTQKYETQGNKFTEDWERVAGRWCRPQLWEPPQVLGAAVGGVAEHFPQPSAPITLLRNAARKQHVKPDFYGD